MEFLFRVKGLWRTVCENKLACTLRTKYSRHEEQAINAFYDQVVADGMLKLFTFLYRWRQSPRGISLLHSYMQVL
jgi:hypothetical protein